MIEKIFYRFALIISVMTLVAFAFAYSKGECGEGYIVIVTLTISILWSSISDEGKTS